MFGTKHWGGRGELNLASILRLLTVWWERQAQYQVVTVQLRQSGTAGATPHVGHTLCAGHFLCHL